ncbi:unnamed protein product (macronuclear) [Paramecium tetraurelia]|uniref:Cyclic nucleotide-binding domain-containing protein n=1 Tax=Paramecium tetraurelia TaxID=5888 RepID=A0D0R7_PARTE|nr:uncharacterized protein GSPATT00012186001 [Paramecium tetraurelia]CAK76634.1 unnamed protein product [Paramecium tetraurelia]|eukprot:XP_001444031.1 hypothetical protein (macronuclear) [Paramecium tetraurelia strain d4-2]
MKQKNKMQLPCCRNHDFCGMKYDFHESDKSQIQIQEERALSANIDQFRQSRGLSGERQINLNQMTEQALDDWYCQSQNRPMEQLLNNKKRFFVPQQYAEELKSRYRLPTTQKGIKEYLFTDQISKNEKYIIQNGESILNPKNLLFNHVKLEPKLMMFGQPIQEREDKKLKRKQVGSRRRGVLLQSDENYRRLSSVDNQSRRFSVHEQPTHQNQQKRTIENHIFLQNYENITRNYSKNEEVPLSFAYKEINQLQQQIEKQEKVRHPEENQIVKCENSQQEKQMIDNNFRSMMKFHQREQAEIRKQLNQAVQSIKQLINPDSEQEQKISNLNLIPKPFQFTQTQQTQNQISNPDKVQQSHQTKKNSEARTRTHTTDEMESSLLTSDMIKYIKECKDKDGQKKANGMIEYIKECRSKGDQTKTKEKFEGNLVEKVNLKLVKEDKLKMCETDSIDYKPHQASMKQANIRSSIQQNPKVSQVSRRATLNNNQNTSQSLTKGNQSQNVTKQIIGWYNDDSLNQNEPKQQDTSSNIPEIKQLFNYINQGRSENVEINEEEDIIYIQQLINPTISNKSVMLSNKQSDVSVANSKQLIQKTKQLLNCNSETRIKYKTELVNFNALLDEKYEKQQEDKYFWYNKGIKHLKENIETALHCFKQALITNPLDSNAVQLVAIIYEKLGKIMTAKKWFQLALQFAETNQLKFRYALCLYKTGSFKASQQLLDLIIQNDNSKDRSLYVYLRGICAKRMFNLERAAEDYKIVKESSRATNYSLCIHFMLAVLFSQKRQLEIKFNPLVFCEFHKLVTSIIEQDVYIENLVKFWINQQWVREEELLVELKQTSFFKRIATSILRVFLKNMKLIVVEKDNVIFPKENEVHIIVAGNVNVYDHRVQYKRPDIIANYKQGDILGCPDKDNGLCNISDIWFLTQTRLELISIQKNYFEELWEAQQQMEGIELLTRLQQLSIFKGVSILTLYKLVYELMEKRNLKKNTVLFNDGSYYENFEYIHLRKQPKATIQMTHRLIDQYKHCHFQSKLKKLIIKHKHKIDQLKYNRMHLEGFYIMLSGMCEIENPNGFNNYYIKYGDYFGETLMFNTKGFNSFGRIRAFHDDVTILKLSRFHFNKIPTLDLRIMEKNCEKRQEILDLDRIYKQKQKIKEIHSQKQHQPYI